MVFSERVRNYGSRGKGVSARDNHIIKGMKALHLLAALAWAAFGTARPVSLGGSFPEPLFSCYVVEGPLQRIMAFPPGKIFATNIFSVARREIY